MALTKINGDVIEANAISSTHLASGAVTHSSLSSITTDNVSEGSTNLYFTNERVDDRVASLLTAGTGITLTYDDAANTLTVAGAAQYGDSDVESYLSGGTGVTFSSGVISIGQDVGTSSTPTFGNITTTGYLAGPATFTIDPAAVGDNTGTVVIAGNLQVDGTTTTINSTTVNIDDLNIQLATGAINAAAANGAGITVDGASATITYDATNDEWDFNKNVNVTGTVTADGLTVDTTATNGVTIKASDNLTTNYPLLVQNNAGTGNLELSPYGINNNLDFKIQQGGVNRIFIESSNGNVGIGTDVPSANLHVSGGNATLYIQDSNNTAGQTGLISSIQGYDSASTKIWGFGRKFGSTALQIDQDQAASIIFNQGGSEIARFNASGQLGIGTSSPDANLHVKDDSAANDTFDVHIEGFRPNLVFEDLSASATDFQLFVDSNRLDFLYGDASTDTKLASTAMSIDSSGNVGIGTTSPSPKLHVYQATGELTPRFEVGDASVTGLRLINNSAHWRAGIQSTSNYVIRDVTNSRNALSINGSDGNVGIGTTSPTSSLDVNGVVSLKGNDFLDSDTNSHYIKAPVHLYLYSNATDLNVAVHSNGNVGIGSTVPNRKLTVQDSLSETYSAGSRPTPLFKISNTSAANGNHATLEFVTEPTSGNQGVAYIGSSVTGSDNANLFFGTRSGASTYNTRMTIDSAGRVGIGTSNPNHKLHVDVGAPASADKTLAAFSSERTLRDIGFVWDDSASTLGVATLTNHHMAFHTNGNSSERMRITNGGQVLINAINPNYPTDYATNGSVATTIIRGPETAATDNALFVYGGRIVLNAHPARYSSRGWIQCWGGGFEIHHADNSDMIFYTDGTENMRIKWSTGRINSMATYNSNAPATHRDVYVENNGDLGYASSVRAHKTNITNYGDASWLYNLDPVTFNYRKPNTTTVTNEDGHSTEVNDGTYSDTEYFDTVNVGFIAEDVEQYDPNLCFYNEVEDEDGNMTNELAGIHYKSMVAPLLKLIQEQKALIDDLQARVTTLEG